MKTEVAVVRCPTYGEHDVRRAVERIFSLCRIRPGDVPDPLLLKPNLLSPRPPEHGVTTHPVLARVLADMIPGHRLLIGDSPANADRPVQTCWDVCGYRAVSDETGAELVRFDQPWFISVTMENRRITVPVTELLRTASLLNLPKLKTHNLVVLTAAIKNLYGLIPGFYKSALHAQFISAIQFSSFLMDYHETLKERVFFNLVDAVVIMEGNGPSQGSLRPLGLLVGGRDAVAVDMVCADILGLRGTDIPCLRRIEAVRGLPDVEVIGDEWTPLSDLALPSGISPGRVGRIPALLPLLKILSRFFSIRPFPDPQKCRRCKACIHVCPASAISGDIRIDAKRCIRCLCCVEVCPHGAMRTRKSFLANRFT